MRITILTLFPEMFVGLVENSIIKRAIDKNIVEINLINIRDYTLNKYNRVDTPPIGGGAGLIMKCQPIVDAINKNKTEDSKVILLSPRGNKYTQEKAHSLAKEKDIILVCGHYEGIDERVNKYIDEMISVGDYILTGGEIGAMAISDSVIRLLDGAISNDSIIEETFENGLLEYPQYTEPFNFNGETVPNILYSGNHKAIALYRRKESLLLTRKYRPDLFKKIELNKQDKKLLDDYEKGITPKWESEALIKGKKFLK